MKLTLPATGAILVTSAAGARRDEGQPALQLDVAREDVDEIDVGDAELGREPEIAIVLLAERAGEVQIVAGEEGGDVDEQAALGRLGGDIAHPDRRGREGMAHALLLVRALAGGAEAGIFDLGDELAADAAEDEQPRAAGQRAVEPDRRRAEPGLERGDIDEAPGNPFRIGRRQRQQDAPAAPVDMDREQPVLLDRVLEDRCRADRWPAPARRRRRGAGR